MPSLLMSWRNSLGVLFEFRQMTSFWFRTWSGLEYVSISQMMKAWSDESLVFDQI